VASFPRSFRIHGAVGEKADTFRKVITIGFEVSAIIECSKPVSHTINNHRFSIPPSERPSRGCAEGSPLRPSGFEEDYRCRDYGDERKKAPDAILPQGKVHFSLSAAHANQLTAS
jgi:hypothetical protein